MVYTTDILTEDLEVIGPVKFVLHAASSAVDTDFVAKLIDVYPDGRAINVAERILPARYRKSLSKTELMVPEEIYKMEIDLIGTANLFRVGHRIPEPVTSSHLPQFACNLNTGQTIYQSAAHSSHLILPVIP